MPKIKTELATLITRRDQLIAKQTAAQAKHQGAFDDRHRNLLEGNLEDEPAGVKKQAAVDSAASALAGFEFTLAAVANAITEKEGQLAAETLSARQDKASKKLGTETDTVETLHTKWLGSTREFIAALDAVAPAHFEMGQIAGYLRNACSEIEMAVDVGIPNLRAFVTNIAAGHMPIPSAPPIVVPVTAAPVPPTQTVFVWHAITWKDHDGMQRVLGKWNEASLPLEAAQFALAANLVVPIDDPRIGKLRGQSPGHPEPNWLNDLDTKIGPNIPGSQFCARVDDAEKAEPFIRPHREPNKPYVIQH